MSDVLRDLGDATVVVLSALVLARYARGWRLTWTRATPILAARRGTAETGDDDE